MGLRDSLPSSLGQAMAIIENISVNGFELEGVPVQVTLDGPIIGRIENAQGGLADVSIRDNYEHLPLILERMKRHPKGLGIEIHKGGRITTALLENSRNIVWTC